MSITCSEIVFGSDIVQRSKIRVQGHNASKVVKDLRHHKATVLHLIIARHHPMFDNQQNWRIFKVQGHSQGLWSPDSKIEKHCSNYTIF